MTLDRQTRYRRIVGGMLYIAMTTRPDISYAVGMLTRCLAYPTDELLWEVSQWSENEETQVQGTQQVLENHTLTRQQTYLYTARQDNGTCGSNRFQCGHRSRSGC